MENMYLAIDIGGTMMKWGLINKQGTIIKKELISSNNGDADTILSSIDSLAATYREQITAIAISAPGFINPDTGYIQMGGAVIGFNDTHLKALIEQRTSLPVTVENDVNCVALAEKWLGKANELTDFACLTVGTGIGGALFLNNQLYHGRSFRSGEFGFMISGNKEDGLSLKNSMSRQASVKGLRMDYAHLTKQPVDKVTGEDVFSAYDEGDERALHVVDHFYTQLANCVINVASVIDPQKILIGGGITRRPTFLDELNEKLTEFIGFPVPTDICYFKNDAGLIGAVANYRLRTENSELFKQ
ncbi:ROK family protein [Salipaludibacillus agaradhaerens]|uniref:ROK family protein n=1 Tax=Salipaludibacillus agaradhaerens TaxID=76935 RepID=UPI001474EA4D|nr:ROK family protein [Salipaludibacillus agaradhaerens]